MSIEIRAISKRFGGFVALDDINLQIPTGELVALLGPSGCGKTTLLRIIAGMESADAGQVLFAGEEAFPRLRGTARTRAGKPPAPAGRSKATLLHLKP